jgi:uridine monophosphate synthetase
VAKGEHILFFDDVVSEGLSKLEGIRSLEQLGADVAHVMVVVDREQGGRENLEKLGYKVHALAKISELVDRLLQNKLISKKQAHAVLDYIRKFKGEDTQSV